jgi:chromosome segregation and condensation protein ScpB
MTLDKEAAIIEAILFLENEPVEISKLVKVSKLDKAVVHPRPGRPQDKVQLNQTAESNSQTSEAGIP